MTQDEMIIRTKELTGQHAAKLELFRAAAFLNQPAEAEILRIHMHTLIDEMLDNVYFSTRHMAEALNGKG